MASTIQVPNETNSSASRVTKEGKKITYALQVIQQPERARACGSGAKSSADRRPVDPPPIVELRVYEGEGPSKSEITFAYNANFFLFATLENARSIAQARGGGPPSTTSFPVLTGTPVAGMAYLDRPSPAGYFIFPDLSVRHEGKYRLSFALYEELKEPKDMDADDRSTMIASHATDAHVSHRLEVKSSPFTVFSAKKFPGLTESTALSRMVAEQGCRVRIRRDVRMRRRENKSSKEWDDYDEDAAYEQARRTATPDAYGHQPGMGTPQPSMDGSERPRSVSNASNASFVPPRRPSMEDMGQSYQANNSYQQMPPPQNTGYSQMSQYASSQNQYQSQFAPPPPQPTSLMQPPSPYSHQGHHANYQAQSSMQPPSQSYNSYMSSPLAPPSYHQSNYEQPGSTRQEANQVEYSQPSTDYRRPSMAQTTQQYPPATQLIPSFGSLDQYNRPQQMNQGVPPLQPPHHNPPVSTASGMHMPNGHSLAPLKTLPPAPAKMEPVSPSYQSPPSSMSAQMSGVPDGQKHQYADSVRPPLAQYDPPPAIGHKRSFGSTFDTQHVNDRLQQGARPNLSAPSYQYGDNTYDEPDVEESLNRTKMMYRRADGTQRQRQVPDLVT